VLLSPVSPGGLSEHSFTITGTHNWLTVWGANLYFWGRLVYAFLYAADFPLARSIIWNIPTIGIVMIVAALLLK
jgi:uncharacterized MAPEG superfamily protein